MPRFAVLALGCVLSTLSLHAQDEIPTHLTVVGSPTAPNFGEAIAGLGDIDQDGAGDFIVGSPVSGGIGKATVFSGSTGAVLYSLQTGVVNDLFATAVSGAGDLNGDGHLDFMVSATRTNFAGRIYIYSGLDGSLIRMIDGTSGQYIGQALASLGDLDGDGLDDILVGSTASGGLITPNSGAVRVHSGFDGSVLLTVFGTWATALLGSQLAATGDVDLDGVPDFAAVSVQQPVAVGPTIREVKVYSGASGAVIFTYVLSSHLPHNSSGPEIASGGDINDDGISDLAIGTFDAINALGVAVGRVDVHSGADGSLLWSHEGDEWPAAFGAAVAFAGDLNGDGIADLAVSAPASSLATQFGGRVSVFSGRDGTRLFDNPGEVLFRQFGRHIASSGDADGDGRGGLIVSARVTSTTTFDPGAVHVLEVPASPYPGSASDLRLRCGVNTPPTLFPFVLQATGGDTLEVSLDSEGTYDFVTPLLAAQPFPTGSPTPQPSGFPEAWLNPSPLIAAPVYVLYDGSTVPLGGLLPPMGLHFTFTLPFGLSGYSIMLQGFALAPSAVTGNPIFTATDGREIRMQ
ncbi:MAG: FG-GAP-like repeat-containing protein [Planctomycetota bacterium]